MKQYGHLDVYEITLTTKAPLFIGDGKMYSATDYLFDGDLRRVHILDQNKFFRLLIQHDLIDAYERFIMSEKKDLNAFLSEHPVITQEEIDEASMYHVSAAYAMSRDRSRKEIRSFTRDNANRVYIPGTALKGMIRSALLFSMMEKGSGELGFLNNRTMLPEGKLLHTLRFASDKPWIDPARSFSHSIMRGVMVSDSEPVLNRNMTICVKEDITTDGSVRILNICRECIKPEVQIRFALTLDRTIVKDTITGETIRCALESFFAYYKENFASHFVLPENAVGFNDGVYCFLGSGGGFFAKTLIYPYLGKKAALKPVSEFMHKRFRLHNHNRDIDLGISPHTLKYTYYDKKYYPMGLCEVDIR